MWLWAVNRSNFDLTLPNYPLFGLHTSRFKDNSYLPALEIVKTFEAKKNLLLYEFLAWNPKSWRIFSYLIFRVLRIKMIFLNKVIQHLICSYREIIIHHQSRFFYQIIFGKKSFNLRLRVEALLAFIIPTLCQYKLVASFGFESFSELFDELTDLFESLCFF